MPEGYTVLLGSIASHGIAPAIYSTLPYDPARDFAPLSLVGTVPNVLVVHPALPTKGFSEFAAYIKKNPGELNYASTGVATSTHLGMELLKPEYRSRSFTFRTSPDLRRSRISWADK